MNKLRLSLSGARPVQLVERRDGQLYLLVLSEDRTCVLAVSGANEGSPSTVLELAGARLEDCALFLLDQGQVCVRRCYHLYCEVNGAWQVVELPVDTRVVWGTDPCELYAIGEERVLWYDGTKWEVVLIDEERPEYSPQYVSGSGVAGLQVVVGTDFTHSCMARGDRDKWAVDGCGSWYLHKVEVFARDHAVAVGGDGVWEFRGGAWEAWIEHKLVRPPIPLQVFGRLVDGHTVAGGLLPGKVPKVVLQRGRLEQHGIDLEGIGKLKRQDPDPRDKQVEVFPAMLQALDRMVSGSGAEEVLRDLYAHETAGLRWLPSGRLAVLSTEQVWISEPISDLAPFADRIVPLNAVAEMQREVDAMLPIPSGPDSSEPAFWIDCAPVTNWAYAAMLAETGHTPPAHWPGGQIPPGKELHPVVGISAQDAAEYARCRGARLPTEQEWELAARGFDGRQYPDGNPYDGLWQRPPEVRTCRVKYDFRMKTPWGVRDLGQVWEWTSTPEESGRGQIVRGGPWRDKIACPALTNRSWEDGPALDVGFRCVRDTRPNEPRIQAVKLAGHDESFLATSDTDIQRPRK